MYTSLAPFQRLVSRLPLRFALRLGLIAICSSTAFAQIGGIDSDPGDRGTGGVNMIQGNIFLPGGRRLDRRAQVKLRSAIGGAEQYQLSDDSGAFSFRRLIGGTYTLTVDAGKEFETAIETVDIVEAPRRRGDSGMVVPVNVVLKARTNTAPGTTGTIDASTGGVPEAARDLYKEAVASASAGDKKKAIQQLNQALQLCPTFMTALNELGVQYMALQEWRKAADALRAALKVGPEAFHPRLNYGIVLLQMKDYKAAVGELQLAVQKDSSSGVAHFQLGRALVNIGNYDAAEKALKQSISIGGDEVIEAHRYLAAVYIETQKSQLAADELDLYLKLAPKAKDAERIRTVIKDLRSQASNKR
ncbi:MAG TPA: tetratricopeptide repeat protein [Blastocatellia bacterium]|nr:tetratricopeptide repeat protein [Blastocatellia bacterium]